MKDELRLKQSNKLILATHRMNIQQMRLFFYACSQYKGDLDIEVSIDDINRVLAYQGGNQRAIVRNAIPTLMQSALVHIQDNTGERWSVAITDSYIEKNNTTVRFTFNKSVQKELEELRGYTWLYLTQLTGMRSTYSVRIYEFFAMRLGANNKKATFDFDMNKLRSYLDCTNKLKDFRNFERTVLKVAEKEINDKSNIKMSYIKIKTGRSITSIKFNFEWKNVHDVVELEEADTETSEKLRVDDFDILFNELKNGTL